MPVLVTGILFYDWRLQGRSRNVCGIGVTNNFFGGHFSIAFSERSKETILIQQSRVSSPKYCEFGTSAQAQRMKLIGTEFYNSYVIPRFRFAEFLESRFNVWRLQELLLRIHLGVTFRVVSFSERSDESLPRLFCSGLFPEVLRIRDERSRSENGTDWY